MGTSQSLPKSTAPAPIESNQNGAGPAIQIGKPTTSEPKRQQKDKSLVLKLRPVGVILVIGVLLVSIFGLLSVSTASGPVTISVSSQSTTSTSNLSGTDEITIGLALQPDTELNEAVGTTEVIRVGTDEVLRKLNMTIDADTPGKVILNGLSSGEYEVIFTDSSGTVSTQRFTVNQ